MITISPTSTRLLVNFQETISPNWIFTIGIRHRDVPPVTHNLRNGVYHRKTHHDGASSVILSEVGEAADAVVAVAENLNPQLMIFLKNKASKGQAVCVYVNSITDQWWWLTFK